MHQKQAPTSELRSLGHRTNNQLGLRPIEKFEELSLLSVRSSFKLSRCQLAGSHIAFIGSGREAQPGFTADFLSLVACEDPLLLSRMAEST